MPNTFESPFWLLELDFWKHAQPHSLKRNCRKVLAHETVVRCRSLCGYSCGLTFKSKRDESRASKRAGGEERKGRRRIPKFCFCMLPGRVNAGVIICVNKNMHIWLEATASFVYSLKLSVHESAHLQRHSETLIFMLVNSTTKPFQK